MAAIRFPASALPLLPLCKGHGEKHIFRTYAEFVHFIAAYGFYLYFVNGEKLQPKPKFTELPNPVSLEVFENRGLYSNLVMLALAYDDSRQIAEHEDQLTSLIEGYAALGAENLAKAIAGIPPQDAGNYFSEIMSATSESTKI